MLAGPLPLGPIPGQINTIHLGSRLFVGCPPPWPQVLGSTDLPEATSRGGGGGDDKLPE